MKALAISFAILAMQASAGIASETPDASAVRDLVKVENDFARLAVEKDWIVAFKSYFAEDGVWFVPAPTNTRESLAKLPPEAANAKVEWYPTLTDASSAGDLGFNLGPYSWSNPDPAKPPRRGYFFTVWKRAPGEPFRVVADFGAPSPEAKPETRSDWRAVRHRRSVPPYAGAAASTLRTADADLCASIGRDGLAKGYARHLDGDAVLLREGGPRRDAKAIRRYLEGAPGAVCYRPEQADVARSGDLGYTYGAYTAGKTAGADTPPAGYYLHVWRRDQKARWRLAVDVVNVAPPAAH